MNRNLGLKKCLSLLVCFALVLTTVLIVSPLQQITASAETTTDEVPMVQVQDFEGTAPEIKISGSDATVSYIILDNSEDIENTSKVLKLVKNTENAATYLDIYGFNISEKSIYNVYFKYKVDINGNSKFAWFHALGDGDNAANQSNSGWQVYNKNIEVSSATDYMRITITTDTDIYIDDIKIEKLNTAPYYSENFENFDLSTANPGAFTAAISNNTEKPEDGKWLELSVSASSSYKFPYWFLKSEDYRIKLQFKNNDWMMMNNGGSYDLNSTTWTTKTVKAYSPEDNQYSEKSQAFGIYTNSSNNRTIYIDNIEIAQAMKVEAIAESGGQATVVNNDALSGDTNFYYNDKITYTATVDSGYNFIGWFNSNNELVSGTRIYERTVDEDNILTAKFKAIDSDLQSNDFEIEYNTIQRKEGTLTFGVTAESENAENKVLEIKHTDYKTAQVQVGGFKLESGETYNISFRYKKGFVEGETGQYAVFWFNGWQNDTTQGFQFSPKAVWQTTSGILTASKDYDYICFLFTDFASLYIDDIVIKKIDIKNQTQGFEDASFSGITINESAAGSSTRYIKNDESDDNVKNGNASLKIAKADNANTLITSINDVILKSGKAYNIKFKYKVTKTTWFYVYDYTKDAYTRNEATTDEWREYDHNIIIGEKDSKLTIGTTTSGTEMYVDDIVVTELTAMDGDIDGDYYVNNSDFVRLQKHLLGIEIIAGNVTNVNKDSEVDIRDLVELYEIISAK